MRSFHYYCDIAALILVGFGMLYTMVEERNGEWLILSAIGTLLSFSLYTYRCLKHVCP